MKISITPSGLVAIDFDTGAGFALSKEEALTLLDWLYSHHDWLRGKDDETPPGDFGRPLDEDEAGYAAALSRSMSVLPEIAPEGAEQEADDE